MAIWLILAGVVALITLRWYSAGFFLHWNGRWLTRNEAPRSFWLVIVNGLVLSVVFLLFALKFGTRS
jgi:hypothetical protein